MTSALNKLLFLLVIAMQPVYNLVLASNTMTDSTIAPIKTIKLASLEWYPYQGSNLPNQGVATDIVMTVLKSKGYEVEIDYLPWSRQMRELENHRFDGILGAYFTKERTQKFIYSDCYLTSSEYFYKRSDSKISWKKLSDLKGYKIGLVRDYANSPQLDNADFLHKEYVNSDIANIKKLLNGSLDLIVINKKTAEYLLITSMAPFFNDIEAIKPPLITHKLCILFNRDDPKSKQYIADFNQGLAKIRKDGTYKKILQRHGFTP